MTPTSHLSVRTRTVTRLSQPLLTRLPSAIVDGLIPGCNRTWDRQHGDLANLLLKDLCNPLESLCIHTRLNTVATAKVKRINLAESDLVVFPKEKKIGKKVILGLIACKAGIDFITII